MYSACLFMKNLLCFVLFGLLLPGTARRRVRLDVVFNYAGQQNTTLTESLDVSAETREALLPGGFKTVLFRGRGPHAHISQLRTEHVEPHLAAPPPARLLATVAPRLASGSEDDQLPSQVKADLVPIHTFRDALGGQGRHRQDDSVMTAADSSQEEEEEAALQQRPAPSVGNSSLGLEMSEYLEGLLPFDVEVYRTAAAAILGVLRDSRNSSRWRSLGMLLYGKGRLEAARACLARAAELDPADAPVRVDLGNVLRSMGRFEQSCRALLEAEAISGKRDQSLLYFGSPLAPGGGEDTQAAAVGRPSTPGSAVWVTTIASDDECAWVIEEAEAFNEARGGWGNPPPRYAPVGTVADEVRAPHMLAADCPAILDWVNRKLESAVLPVLRQQFGEVDLWLYDCFLLKFDGQPGREGLSVHVDDDGLGVSFNLLLSSPSDFLGGGTFFEENGNGSQETVFAAQGEMVSHHGGLQHASVPTRGGRRYILVGFLRSTQLLRAPPSYVRL